MVDASIGGKTGIDFLDFKNQIGAFSSPEGVWIFPDFLKTLPESELISGFAEVIKHALIADLKGWQVFRKKELHDQNWPQLISESLKVKAQIVENDPFEKGERQKLNAGHTLGHALESLQMAKGKPIPHGFCVAAGLVMESRISLEKGWLPEKELLEIEELTFTIFGKMEFDKGEIKRILKYTQQDKKNEKGRVKAALIGPIGNCQTGVEITESDMEMALKYYLLGE
jgi:3-dehydroquinate synthase